MLISETYRKGFSAALAVLLLIPGSQGVQAQSMSVVDLNMTVGKSLVIDYPVEIGRISTSSPEVVDAVPATNKEFLLHGKGHGAATVVVWAKNGARTMYNVTVEHNTDPIKKLIADTFPNEDIHIQSARDSISLTGKVSSKEVADRAVAIATPMAKTVVNNLSVLAGPVDKQIVLKVKFAELNRNRSQQFGVNILSTGTAGTPGRVTTGQFPAPSPTTVAGTIGGALEGTRSTFNLSDALNVFAFRPDLNLGAVIRALQNEDILQILAEPNLVTMNGKEASFLVGGEFPVPVLQGGGNAGAVTIQFREFGIRLTFNPQITANGTIRMYVKPEVSTIDLANAVTLSGFTIPALATRRMETNVELKEGQSFVVAGLIDDRVTDQMSRIPGLSNIPILGTIFKSRNERKSKSELIVLVTPEIVQPLDPGQKAPIPTYPREFMKQNEMMKNSKSDPNANPATPKNLNAKNDPAPGSKDGSAPLTADQATRPNESGVLKNIFFWRNGKKSGQVPVEAKASMNATPVAESPAPLAEPSAPIPAPQPAEPNAEPNLALAPVSQTAPPLTAKSENAGADPVNAESAKTATDAIAEIPPAPPIQAEPSQAETKTPDPASQAPQAPTVTNPQAVKPAVPAAEPSNPSPVKVIADVRIASPESRPREDLKISQDRQAIRHTSLSAIPDAPAPNPANIPTGGGGLF